MKSQNVNFFQSTSEYVKIHSMLIDFQILNLIVSILFFLTVLVFEIVEFTAAKSTVDSAAAVWQTSIETIQIDNFFAWCQSATMNEATVNSIQVVNVVDTIFTKMIDISMLIETFKKRFRIRNSNMWRWNNWCNVAIA